MLKVLSKKTDNPGFSDAIVLTNKSADWLVIDAKGRRVPPRSHFAISRDVLESAELSDFLKSGIIVANEPNTVNSEPKPRKRKKSPDSQPEHLPEQQAEQIPVVTVSEPQEVQQDQVVANSAPENWVSSNENNVGEPTPEQI